MKVAENTYDVGVIIGRFQVPDLHEAHRALIQHVCDKHDKVIVLLGLSPLRATKENPLDFESRKQMIAAEFPQINILYVKDVNSDETWSRRVDEIVGDVLTPAQTAVLYGSRDSFIEHYFGKLPCLELEQNVYISGTEIRRHIATRSVKATGDFRAGVIWATQSQYPKVHATVDVAILNSDATKILLGRKPTEDQFRFIGGFSDPADASFEEAAHREVEEETGAVLDTLEYLGSFKIDDWRYRSETDKIITTFFKAHHVSGDIRPGDDIAEVRWFDIDALTHENIVETHWPLLNEFLR